LRPWTNASGNCCDGLEAGLPGDPPDVADGGAKSGRPGLGTLDFLRKGVDVVGDFLALVFGKVVYARANFVDDLVDRALSTLTFSATFATLLGPNCCADGP
jgi:hypothetical protein